MQQSYYTTLPYGVLKISGQNNVKFLQGQLTYDVSKITTQNSSYGAYCNIKGRIQAFFRLFKIEEDFYLRLPLELLEKTKTELTKYGLFSKVLIEDVTNQMPVIGLWQETNQTVLKKIVCEGEKNRIEVYSDFEVSGLTEKSFNEWAYEDILAGIPEVTDETYEQFLPHHLNLINLNAVSLNKGCYRGQEIIARMHHQGNIKKQMIKTTYKTSQMPEGKIIRAAKSGDEEMTALVEARLDLS